MHTTSVLVIHTNQATSYASRRRCEAAVFRKKAYWRDLAQTVLVMVPYDEVPADPGYEYGGKKSYDRRSTAEACDMRTRVIIQVPVELQDRTGIPVRQAGGHKVMQLKEKRDRRTTGGFVAHLHDDLWHPDRMKPTPSEMR